MTTKDKSTFLERMHASRKRLAPKGTSLIQRLFKQAHEPKEKPINASEGNININITMTNTIPTQTITKTIKRKQLP